MGLFLCWKINVICCKYLFSKFSGIQGFHRLWRNGADGFKICADVLFAKWLSILLEGKPRFYSAYSRCIKVLTWHGYGSCTTEKSLTPSTQKEGSQEKRVCTSLPVQECLISAFHSRATPTASFEGMLGVYHPPHIIGTAGLSSPCRLSDLYVRWQLLESYSKTWSGVGFDLPARGDLALCKKLEGPGQHLLPFFWSEGCCTALSKDSFS